MSRTMKLTALPLLVLAGLLSVLDTSWGQQAAPIDRSSPKATVKALYSAVERADSAAIRQILFIDGDPQQELVQAYADLIIAGKRLADAAKQKYPGAANALAQGTISTEDASKIDSSVVTVEGDNAVMKISGRPEPVPLRRVNGQWQVVYGQGADVNAQDRPRRLGLLNQLSSAMDQSAAEISADKYPTVQDAEAAVKERLSAVLSKALQPSNMPTSRPTTMR